MSYDNDESCARMDVSSIKTASSSRTSFAVNEKKRGDGDSWRTGGSAAVSWGHSEKSVTSKSIT